MTLEEYYKLLNASLDSFENSEQVKVLLQNAAHDDKTAYEKFKTTLKAYAEVGIKGASPDTYKPEKISCYFEGKKHIGNIFGPDEYPEDLKDQGPLVKAFILQVWVPHKERFADVEFDYATAAVASALSYIPYSGFEGISQTKENYANQAREMRKILCVSAPKITNDESIVSNEHSRMTASPRVG